jgi:hypothetical protein
MTCGAPGRWRRPRSGRRRWSGTTPPDLINVALERIVEASLELPGYSTLDDMAATIRAEVNEAIFAGIVARMGPEGCLRAQGLLDTAGPMAGRCSTG